MDLPTVPYMCSMLLVVVSSNYVEQCAPSVDNLSIPSYYCLTVESTHFWQRGPKPSTSCSKPADDSLWATNMTAGEHSNRAWGRHRGTDRRWSLTKGLLLVKPHGTPW